MPGPVHLTIIPAKIAALKAKNYANADTSSIAALEQSLARGQANPDPEIARLENLYQKWTGNSLYNQPTHANSSYEGFLNNLGFGTGNSTLDPATLLHGGAPPPTGLPHPGTPTAPPVGSSPAPPPPAGSIPLPAPPGAPPQTGTPSGSSVVSLTPQGPQVAPPIFPPFPLPSGGGAFTNEAYNLAGIPRAPQHVPGPNDPSIPPSFMDGLLRALQNLNAGGTNAGSFVPTLPPAPQAGGNAPITGLPGFVPTLPPAPQAGGNAPITGLPGFVPTPNDPRPGMPAMPGFVPTPNDPRPANPIAGTLLQQILGGGGSSRKGMGMISKV